MSLERDTEKAGVHSRLVREFGPFTSELPSLKAFLPSTLNEIGLEVGNSCVFVIAESSVHPALFRVGLISMNNSQFRRLLDISNTSTANNQRTANATPKRDGLVAAALGSRIRSSIPMTP